MRHSIRLALPLFAFCCLASTVQVQADEKRNRRPPSRKWIDNRLPPPVLIKGLEISVDVERPALVDPEAAEQLKAHRAFREANEAWEAAAQQRMDELNSTDGTSYSVWTNRIGYLPIKEFPQEVTRLLPPRPEHVAPPATTDLDWTLTFKNTGEKAIEFGDNISSDIASIDIYISGPGAVRIQRQRVSMTREYRGGPWRTLQPGEKHTIKLKGLKFGRRRMMGDYAITQPGTCTLLVCYRMNATRKGKCAYEKATTKFEAKLAE